MDQNHRPGPPAIKHPIHPTTLKINPITSMMDQNHRPGPPAIPPDVIHHTLLES